MLTDDIKQKYRKFDWFTDSFQLELLYLNISETLCAETQDEFDDRVLNIVMLSCFKHFGYFSNRIKVQNASTQASFI